MILPLLVLLAQIPDVNWASALFAYGPLGIGCVGLSYFCFVKLEKFGDKIVASNDAVILEMRVFGHRLNGIGKAMWAEVASRHHISEETRRMVDREIEKLNNDDEVADIRSRARSPMHADRDGT